MAYEQVQEASKFRSRCIYDVFLSFRGEDTRKTFTNQLYEALVDVGLRTFKDDNEVESGENINSELDKAIHQSKGSVIVLSKNYASSSWCLDELVMILESKKNRGHVILPVFYNVNPSDVGNTLGSFAIAFARHENRLMENSEDNQAWAKRIEGWRKALKEVASLGGMTLQGQNERKESTFIEKVIRVIEEKINRSVIGIASYLTGIDSRAKDLNLWLNNRTDTVSVAGVCGMGGIGKTTIAKYVFNINYADFEGSSFLENIRQYSEYADGLIHLQKQFLADILNGQKKEIQNVHEGIYHIKVAVYGKRILVILDDIDRLEQLNAVLGMRDCFHPGSRIIITTRHWELLRAYEIDKVHFVEKLSKEESFQLFSWHAFGENQQTENYQQLSERVIKHCEGLPLALQLLGSSLSGKSERVWESALNKLEAIPNSQVALKLKISYDSLQDDHDRNVFLDIACFFVGKNVNIVATILEGCGYYEIVGIQNLIDRFLLTVNQNEKVVMHQSVIDMGREIVRQESTRNAGKRSRLWYYKDCIKVLEEKTATDTIQGLSLSVSMKKGKPPMIISGKNIATEYLLEYADIIRKAKLASEANSVKRQTHSSFFPWPPQNSVGSTQIVLQPKRQEFDMDAFSRMHGLRLLQLDRTLLRGSYKEFPRKLRWLCWRNFPYKQIPDDLSLESLVVLQMRYSQLKHIWSGTRFLRRLRILDLSNSSYLSRSPNFTELPNLERLFLKYCTRLIEIDESIGQLNNLFLLNLTGCENLRGLPTSVGDLKSLERLFLSGCSKLDWSSVPWRNMQSLKQLYADRTAKGEAPSPTGVANILGSVFCSLLPKPRDDSTSISFSLALLPRSLQILDLADCKITDDIIPNDLGHLCMLEELILNKNPITTLPKGIKNLAHLRSLQMAQCEKLQFLPELPETLNSLSVHECRSLEVITNLPNLLTSLDFLGFYCGKLKEVQELFKLKPIENCDSNLTSMFSLVDSEILIKVHVNLYNFLTLTRWKGPIQGLYEFGIFSISLPINEMPQTFTYRSTGNPIHFNVPSVPHLHIHSLNICIIYKNSDISIINHEDGFWNENRITINNKTKDLNWTYSPVIMGIPYHDEGITWLSQWKIGQYLDRDDRVRISVALMHGSQLEEFGVQIVYEVNRGNAGQIYPYRSQHLINGVDISAFEVTRGSYFLCHHDLDTYQENSKNDGWRTNGWLDFLFKDSEEETNTDAATSGYMLKGRDD
ncbi:disease resistance protein RPP2B-like [Lycium ferocissimum]|uniref:disease resistance protein RPP2B-like n=1 Tax=Lycium ferocissimum TaxID=112874 RepID=UPI0028166611|nr:disease resistance protein RPP2B-like [Lycium ferocissimum]